MRIVCVISYYFVLIEITPPPQFSVRLIGGSTEYEGRVEFYYNGQWGTVCNDSFDINDAEVVCRQLHFNGANETLGSAQFGTGTGPIWLDDVWCNGSEQELSECPHSSNNSFGNHNCNHQQDAGVRCTGRHKYTKLLVRFSQYFQLIMPIIAYIIKMDVAKYN